MTDNEVIIDGVDVQGCKNFNSAVKPANNCQYKEFTRSCKGRNCYYKQLQRKTAECEKLNEEFKIKEQWRINDEHAMEKLDLKIGKYKSALEKIEKIINEVGGGSVYVNARYSEIQDIINKAKGVTK